MTTSLTSPVGLISKFYGDGEERRRQKRERALVEKETKRNHVFIKFNQL